MSGNIILIGMPGSGKSAAGRALAKLLRRPLAETDAAAEKAAGMTIAEIFAKLGEKHFRALESAALETALGGGGKIISTGGGAVLAAKNRRRIRAAGTAVYLSAPPPLLEKRIAADAAPRPLLAKKDLGETLAALLEKREVLYRQTAHLEIVQDAEDAPADVAEKIRAGLRHTGGAV